MNIRESTASPHFKAFIVVAIGVVFAVFYATIIPFGEKPDEPSHMARVVYLAESGTEPRMFDASVFPGIVIYERVQPPLYYRLSSYIMNCLPRVDWSISPDRGFGCVDRGRRFQLDAARDPPLHVLVIRCLGILFIAVSGLCLYCAAYRIFTQPHDALAALILYMMTPQILFIGSSVSNDAPAMFMGSFIVAYMTWRSKFNPVLFGVAAAVFALAGIGIKENLAAFLIGIPVLLIWRRSGRQCIASFFGFMVGLCAVFVAIWIRGHLSFHGLIDAWSWRLSHRAVNLVSLVPKDYPVAIGSLIRSYWAQFGWMDMHPPAGISWLWYCLILVSSVGIVIGPVRTRLKVFPLYVLLGFAVLGWLFSLGSYSQIQGRFLFPYAAAVSIILVYGLSGVRIEKWWWILGVLLIGVNLVCILQLGSFYRNSYWPEDLELDAHQCYADRIVLNTLSDGFEIGQTFQCEEAGLSVIDLVFEGTHRVRGVVEMSLVDENTKRVVRTFRADTDSIKTGEYTRFTFEPVMKSARRNFSLRVRLVDSSGTGDLSLRYALGDLFPEGTRLEDGLVREGDIRFVTWCKLEE